MLKLGEWVYVKNRLCMITFIYAGDCYSVKGDHKHIEDVHRSEMITEDEAVELAHIHGLLSPMIIDLFALIHSSG